MTQAEALERHGNRIDTKPHVNSSFELPSNNNNHNNHHDFEMTKKSPTPASVADRGQLLARFNTMADDMNETRAANEKLHDTVNLLSKRLDDQTRASKSDIDKLQATIDKLVLVTQSLSEAAMASNDRNDQLQVSIEKSEEQHDDTRQQLGKIPLHIREDFNHLFQVVHSLRLHDDKLEASIEDKKEKLTAHCANENSDAELNTLKCDHDFLLKQMGDLALTNDKFQAEIVAMKSLQADGFDRHEKVEETLATTAKQLAEATTISNDKTRERIGMLRSDLRDDYKDMLRMIADVSRENEKLRYKVEMMEGKMVHDSTQIAKHEDQIANLEKDGDNRDRKFDLLVNDIANQGHNIQKGYDHLRELIKEQEGAIGMVRQHLCGLDKNNEALKGQFDDFLRRSFVFEDKLRTLDEKTDQLTRDFKEEKKKMSKKFSDFSNVHLELQKQIASTEVIWVDFDKKIEKLAVRLDAQSIAWKKDMEDSQEKILKFSTMVTKNQKV